ncbi:MAG: MetS family NSS transporter small subunit [bacterium]|nr:MetS family NSS transporter small subunit [bacterium]
MPASAIIMLIFASLIIYGGLAICIAVALKKRNRS